MIHKVGTTARVMNILRACNQSLLLATVILALTQCLLQQTNVIILPVRRKLHNFTVTLSVLGQLAHHQVHIDTLIPMMSHHHPHTNTLIPVTPHHQLHTKTLNPMMPPHHLHTNT